MLLHDFLRRGPVVEKVFNGAGVRHFYRSIREVKNALRGTSYEDSIPRVGEEKSLLALQLVCADVQTSAFSAEQPEYFLLGPHPQPHFALRERDTCHRSLSGLDLQLKIVAIEH